MCAFDDSRIATGHVGYHNCGSLPGGPAVLSTSGNSVCVCVCMGMGVDKQMAVSDTHRPTGVTKRFVWRPLAPDR